MARDVDAERLFTDKKFRPARRDGLILLVDRDVDGREERVTPGGVVVQVPLGDMRRATVIGVGDHIKDVSSGDRLMIHKAYGLRIEHGLGEQHKLILVTWNQIEAVIEDEGCLE